MFYFMFSCAFCALFELFHLFVFELCTTHVQCDTFWIRTHLFSLLCLIGVCHTTATTTQMDIWILATNVLQLMAFNQNEVKVTEM